MALGTLSEQIGQVVARELGPRTRYRVLLLQSGDLEVVASLYDHVVVAAQKLGGEIAVLRCRDQFDLIGAVSCRTLLDRIEACGHCQPVVLEGPMHYVDYWSDQVAAAFWRYLGSFGNGPGIIAIDTPREGLVETAFKLAGRIPGSDVRFLRSRLAMPRDGLA